MNSVESVETAVAVKLRPLGARVLVRVEEPRDVKKNGLFIPDVAIEKPLEGTVLAVGNGHVRNGERVPVDVRVGQRVVFGKYSGNSVELDEIGKALLLQEEELQAVFED